MDTSLVLVASSNKLRGRSRGKITVPILFPEDDSCVIGAWCHLYGVVCCNNAPDRDTRKPPKCCFVDRPIAWSVERITEVNVCFVTLMDI